jgi:hypothetical protein
MSTLRDDDIETFATTGGGTREQQDSDQDDQDDTDDTDSTDVDTDETDPS